MIKKIDIKNETIVEELLKLQLLSYNVEAELIDFYEIPPLKDTIKTLQQCDEIFYGHYEQDGELSGVISIKVEKNVLDIHRLMVHPKHFRKGIANMLLAFVEGSEKEIDKIIVSTGTKNTPAVRFYEINGFSKTGETRITEQLSLTSFIKILH